MVIVNIRIVIYFIVGLTINHNLITVNFIYLIKVSLNSKFNIASYKYKIILYFHIVDIKL